MYDIFIHSQELYSITKMYNIKFEWLEEPSCNDVRTFIY